MSFCSCFLRSPRFPVQIVIELPRALQVLQLLQPSERTELVSIAGHLDSLEQTSEFLGSAPRVPSQKNPGSRAWILSSGPGLCCRVTQSKNNDTMQNLALTREALEAEVEKRAPWYHNIDLGLGVTTPGRSYDSIWEKIRLVRRNIDYKQKRVLDIASYDGMWAFEAERLGAAEVVATDVTYHAFEHFLFCKQVLRFPGRALLQRLSIQPSGTTRRSLRRPAFGLR